MLCALSRRTAGRAAVLRAGEQQFQMIVDLRHRADGGARGAHRVHLVDRDGRRDTLDVIDARLVHAVEEQARVGREGLA
jgi:hypothetical protein